MGRLKQLLPWPPNSLNSEPVLVHTIKIFLSAGVSGIVVVLGHRADEIIPALHELPVVICSNPHPDSPMSTSIVSALDSIPIQSNILLHPGDHPAVKIDTVSLLLQIHQQHPDRIVVPVFNGRRGHPAIFPAIAREKLAHPDPDHGVRAILQSEIPLLEVSVNDPGVRINLDYPQDYSAAPATLT